MVKRTARVVWRIKCIALHTPENSCSNAHFSRQVIPENQSVIKDVIVSRLRDVWRDRTSSGSSCRMHVFQQGAFLLIQLSSQFLFAHGLCHLNSCADHATRKSARFLLAASFRSLSRMNSM